MPYLFIAVFWVVPIDIILYETPIKRILINYGLALGPSQLWFLWMLFWVFAIVWLIKEVMIAKPEIGYIIAMLFYGVGIIGSKLFLNVYCIWTSFLYIPFFYIGMRIRIKEENGERLLTEIIPWFCWVGIDLIVFIGKIIVGKHTGTIWSLLSLGMNFTLHVIGAIMAWSTLQTLANKVNWQKSKAFIMLSSYSMPMYLFHQQIIYFTIAWLDGKVNPWINAGVNYVVALAVSFAISGVLMRWDTTRFLIGEK